MIVNEEIRKTLHEARMYQWQLAMELGINESTLTRRLRSELPEEEKQQIISIIRAWKEAKEV